MKNLANDLSSSSFKLTVWQKLKWKGRYESKFTVTQYRKTSEVFLMDFEVENIRQPGAPLWGSGLRTHSPFYGGLTNT